jgi:hypothetical protein
MQRERSAPTRARVESTRTRALSTLSACALLAGCLVTNELDFEPNRNPALVMRKSPGISSRAPSRGDPDCNLLMNGTLSMKFDAAFYDEDVEQPLFVLPYLNGRPRSAPLRAVPNVDGSPLHLLSSLYCIPVAELSQPCNRVQFFVSDDYQKLFDLPLSGVNSTNDPGVSTLDWLVAPPASDTPGGPGMPEAQPSDCINEADGGV